MTRLMCRYSRRKRSVIKTIDFEKHLPVNPSKISSSVLYAFLTFKVNQVEFDITAQLP